MAKTVALATADMFTEIEGAKALISSRGLWTPAAVVKRDDMLFAAHGKGFIRLLARNLTSLPNARWEAVEGVAYREEYNGLRIGLAAVGKAA